MSTCKCNRLPYKIIHTNPFYPCLTYASENPLNRVKDTVASIRSGAHRMKFIRVTTSGNHATEIHT